MLVSPPFLPPRGAAQDDAAYLNAAMPTLGHGHYPVSNKLSWHGGLHLQAPPRGNGREPVRAIADGTVAYVRQPTPRPSSPEQAETHALGYNGWSDDGCVVLCHDTAIGATDDTETEVRFYSIYLHLNDIRTASVVPGQTVHRKTELGTAGMFEGSANLIHLEIICDDTNLQRLIGRNAGLLDIHADGRTDAVFGELYFKLPADTQVYPERPVLNQATGTGGAALGEELFVGIRYGNGNAQVTTYRADSTTLATALTENNAEYELYRYAGRIVEAFRTAGAPQIPAQSATYELLRFGRILGPDALNPAHTPHWRQIPTPNGRGWVNLNATGVTKYSDADAPHWAGWHLLQDYQDNDSRCDVAPIRRVLDEDGDGIATRAEAERRLSTTDAQRFLRGAVCKFPTEWQRSGIADRWNWLTTEDPNADNSGPPSLGSNTYLSKADFPAFQRHVEALAFWEEAALPGIEPAHWHFHPARFIEHFRKCGWISRREFEHIYPGATATNRTRYLIEINRCTRKYNLTERLAISHFLGQAAVESGQLRWMSEIYNGDPNDYFRRYERARNYENWLGNVQWNDGGTYRGRGFKQLTGRSNYKDYWVYRGWLDPTTVGREWWRNTGWWGIQGNYVRAQHQNIQPIQNPAVTITLSTQMRPPIITDPDRVRTNTHDCIDTAGWFWSKNGLLAIARDNNAVLLTNRIRGDNAQNAAQFPPAANYPQRLQHTQRIYNYFGDSP